MALRPCRASPGRGREVGRRNAIERSPEQVRATIDGLIRKGRFTLDEILDYVRAQHGDEAVPSRSGLHRYTRQQSEMLEKMRAIDAAARVVVEELGESPDDRAGALLVQSITTLATDAALRAHTEDGASVDEVRKLAREQEAQLKSLEKAGGLSHDAAQTIRRQILGIAA